MPTRNSHTYLLEKSKESHTIPNEFPANYCNVRGDKCQVRYP